MKIPRLLITLLTLVTVTSACVDPSVSSGGGGSSQVVVPELVGNWRGTTGGLTTGSITDFVDYPIIVRLDFDGAVLVGSVEISDCLPQSPITSGSVTRVKGTDVELIRFTATTPDQKFSFFAGQLSDDHRSMTGLAALTSNSFRCSSFDLGSASLERAS